MEKILALRDTYSQKMWEYIFNFRIQSFLEGIIIFLHMHIHIHIYKYVIC